MFKKTVEYWGEKEQFDVLLPSGDEKYKSFWVRDCVMMAESELLPVELLEKYIDIFASCGQNNEKTLYLENNLVVPPFAVADHVNYNASPVFFPGTYEDGTYQGDGTFGFFPPFCDNFYFILLVLYYLNQGGSIVILNRTYNGYTLEKRLESAFSAYGIDSGTELCRGDADKYTVDWGFADTVKKSGYLLMPSLLRYTAAEALAELFKENPAKVKFYNSVASKISENIRKKFYDTETGWLYSATGLCKQHDVWATVLAVYLGVLDEKKTFNALKDAYLNRTAVSSGQIRQILTTEDAGENAAWETVKWDMNRYQNGGYWATATGWYAAALYKYDRELAEMLIDDFIEHTKKYSDVGAPFEWIDKDTTIFEGCRYGTSGVLPYIAYKKCKDGD